MQQKAAVKYENEQEVEWWTGAAKARLSETFQPSVDPCSHTNTLLNILDRKNRFNSPSASNWKSTNHSFYAISIHLDYNRHINVRSKSVLTEHRHVPNLDSQSIHKLYGLRWVSWTDLWRLCEEHIMISMWLTLWNISFLCCHRDS